MVLLIFHVPYYGRWSYSSSMYQIMKDYLSNQCSACTLKQTAERSHSSSMYHIMEDDPTHLPSTILWKMMERSYSSSIYHIIEDDLSNQCSACTVKQKLFLPRRVEKKQYCFPSMYPNSISQTSVVSPRHGTIKLISI